MAVVYKMTIADKWIDGLAVRTYPVLIYEITHNISDSLIWLFEIFLPSIPHDMMVAVLISSGYSVVPPAESESYALSEALDEVSTLESICIGRTEKRQKEVAQMLDIVLKHVKGKVKNKTHHAAVCVAIYKLAVLLGKVKGKEEVKASEWRRTLEARYNVFISDGIAKYNFKSPKSNVFKKAIMDAYDYISTNYPLWIDEKTFTGDLPKTGNNAQFRITVTNFVRSKCAVRAI
jgi:hypothetical protein